MLNLILFLFILLLPVEQYAAAMHPPARVVRTLAPLPELMPMHPKTRVESTLFFPGFVHGTTHKDYLSQNLVCPTLARLVDMIPPLGLNVLEARRFFDNIDLGNKKGFHIFYLNHGGRARDKVLGYGFYSGDVMNGLTYHAGNMPDIADSTSEEIKNIIRPFTTTGAGSKRSLDKNLRIFLSSATKDSGVIKIPHNPAGKGTSAQALAGAQTEKHRNAAEMINPGPAALKFLKSVTEDCVAAIHYLGYMLLKAEIKINELENAVGRNYDWPRNDWTQQRYVETVTNLANFWSSLGQWAFASLRAVPGVDDPFSWVSRFPTQDQKLEALKKFSRYDSTRMLFAHMVLNTSAWMQLIGDGDTGDTNLTDMRITDQARVRIRGEQQTFDNARGELEAFIGNLAAGARLGGQNIDFILDRDDVEKATNYLHKIINSLLLAEMVLASTVTLEAQLHQFSKNERESVKKSLDELQKFMAGAAFQIMSTLSLQIEQLKNAPRSQNVFKTLKAMLCPFYLGLNTEKLDYDESMRKALKIQQLRYLCATILQTSDVATFGNNFAPDRWVTWMDAVILSLTGHGVGQPLESPTENMAAIRELMENPAFTIPQHMEGREAPNALLEDIDSTLRLYNQADVLEQQEDIESGLLNSFTQLIFGELSHFMTQAVLLPKKHWEEMSNLKPDGTIANLTLEKAMFRLDILDRIANYHNTYNGRVIFTDAEIDTIRQQIVFVKDSHKKKILTTEAFNSAKLSTRPIDNSQAGPLRAAIIPGGFKKARTMDQRFAWIQALAKVLYVELQRLVPVATQPTPSPRLPRGRARAGRGEMA